MEIFSFHSILQFYSGYGNFSFHSILQHIGRDFFFSLNCSTQIGMEFFFSFEFFNSVISHGFIHMLEVFTAFFSKYSWIHVHIVLQLHRWFHPHRIEPSWCCCTSCHFFSKTAKCLKLFMPESVAMFSCLQCYCVCDFSNATDAWNFVMYLQCYNFLFSVMPNPANFFDRT